MLMIDYCFTAVDRIKIGLDIDPGFDHRVFAPAFSLVFPAKPPHKVAINRFRDRYPWFPPFSTDPCRWSPALSASQCPLPR